MCDCDSTGTVYLGAGADMHIRSVHVSLLLAYSGGAFDSANLFANKNTWLPP